MGLFLGYGVGPGDKRFVVIQNEGVDLDRSGITVFQNWFAEFDQAR